MIIHNNSIWSEQFLSSLVACIVETRPHFEKTNSSAMFTSGWRFNDNDRCVNCALSLIIDRLNSGIIPSNPRRLEHMASILMNQIVWEALKECSESDEWYYFHKDWG